MPRLAARFPALDDLRVLVVGLGASGLAAARLASARGAHVTVTDRRPADEIGEAAETAASLGARLALGGHPATLADETDLVVISPGVPSDIELIQAARARDLPVWGEIELAARFCRGRVIGITGSNGKSTVTTMIGAVLREAGIPGGVGGNLATPFADLLIHDSEEAIHAIELSSFQLETLETLRPAVAMILNLSPDHLDRYPSLAAYARAKARLFEVQEDDGFALLNADDQACETFREAVRGKLLTFSTRDEVEQGAFVHKRRLILRVDGEDRTFLRRSELPLPGEHNLANALAAALACDRVGCDIPAIARGLTGFRGLRHRLERVRNVGGVEFYNDSKATNPSSTEQALRSFRGCRVHLILGGRAKGNDWSGLVPTVGHRAKRVLLVGEASDAIELAMNGSVPTQRCETIPQAVVAGLEGAERGDVVLLAPACASFDQYRNFEERGDDFRRAVEALPEPADG